MVVEDQTVVITCEKPKNSYLTQRKSWHEDEQQKHVFQKVEPWKHDSSPISLHNITPSLDIAAGDCKLEMAQKCWIINDVYQVR